MLARNHLSLARVFFFSVMVETYHKMSPILFFRSFQTPLLVFRRLFPLCSRRREKPIQLVAKLRIYVYGPFIFHCIQTQREEIEAPTIPEHLKKQPPSLARRLWSTSMAPFFILIMYSNTRRDDRASSNDLYIPLLWHVCIHTLRDKTEKVHISGGPQN